MTNTTWTELINNCRHEEQKSEKRPVRTWASVSAEEKRINWSEVEQITI